VKKNYAQLDFYNQQYSNFSEQKAKKDAQYLISRLGAINFKEGGRFLDVGSGAGILASEIMKEHKMEAYGIDLASRAVEESRKRGIKTKRADFEKKWPFRNNFFDIVISVQTIEHVINTDFFVREAKRVLRKGGSLVLTTPNLACWFNRVIFLFGYQPFFLEVSTEDKTLGLDFTQKLSPNRNPLGHIRVFTKRAMEDFLRLHGLKEIKFSGGIVNYLPKYMKPLDQFFSRFPSFSTDIIVTAKK
jgi:SAM-dependent methyltransferase